MNEYITEFPDGTLVRWRPITWAEHKEVDRLYSQYIGQGAAEWLYKEAIAALCIMEAQDPSGEIHEDIGELPAGVIEVVGTAILNDASFLGTVDQLKKHYVKAKNEIFSSYLETLKPVIMALFKITEQEMAEWTIDKYMKYIIWAEVVTGQDYMPKAPEETKGKRHRQMIDGPDGRKIPLLTREDLEKGEAPNFEEDFKAMRREELRDPEDLPKPPTNRPLHPARIKAAQGKKVHPLRKRMMERGII